MDRRSFLAALPLLPAAAQTLSVRSLGARGDGRSDDSAAFQAALDRARSVWVPAGRYRVGDLPIGSHTRLHGEGARSVLVHKEGSALLASAQADDNGSPDPRDNVRDIAIEDLAFEGRSVAEGFFETHHLLDVAGGSRSRAAASPRSRATRSCSARAIPERSSGTSRTSRFAIARPRRR